MEFKKLRKGFLKEGIKVLSFTLTLSVLMLSIFAFRSDKEAEAATFSVDGNTLTCDGETYTKGAPTASNYGVNVYVFTNSSTTENII
ncbi:MAG: hypothetical protein MJ246_02100 [Clostridia bacterium]|nr:hypothetical protein [Clostridia bacterium]